MAVQATIGDRIAAAKRKLARSSLVSVMIAARVVGLIWAKAAMCANPSPPCQPRTYMRNQLSYQCHPRYVPRHQIQEMGKDAKFQDWGGLFEDRRSWRNPDMPRLSAWVVRERPPTAKNIVFGRKPYY